jgi:hypothetical protein
MIIAEINKNGFGPRSSSGFPIAVCVNAIMNWAIVIAKTNSVLVQPSDSVIGIMNAPVPYPCIDAVAK